MDSPSRDFMQEERNIPEYKIQTYIQKYPEIIFSIWLSQSRIPLSWWAFSKNEEYSRV